MNNLSIDLVWDSRGCGTVECSRAGTLRVGEEEGWRPDELFSIAVEADVMSRFMKLAAGRDLPVLGYISAADLVPREARGRRYDVIIRPCVVLGDPEKEPAARELLIQAFQESLVCGSLRRARLEGSFVIERRGDGNGAG